VSSAHAY
ncbi:ribonucleotide reductase, all-alpha domain protein, partial [Vibrio parahaemolyticus 861]